MVNQYMEVNCDGLMMIHDFLNIHFMFQKNDGLMMVDDGLMMVNDG